MAIPFPKRPVLRTCIHLVLFWAAVMVLALYGIHRTWPTLNPVNRLWTTSLVPETLRFWDVKDSNKLRISEDTGKHLTLENLGALASRNALGWVSLNCDRSRKLRHISFFTSVGNLSFYIYDSASEDSTVTARALQGWYFEVSEMAEFINVSRDLPLIDIGANVGLVTLQAAMQGRQVIAVEPIPENALRLCRSVTDFGHASLVHVIQNAVSSQPGNVTLAMPGPKSRTQYEVMRSKGGYGATGAYSILLDNLLDFLPFKTAALKIDVESHEGHVLAGAERLFQEVDIPMVWMEWQHVKQKLEYGADFILHFMKRHSMEPYNLMTGQQLSTRTFLRWPFTVLWKKTK